MSSKIEIKSPNNNFNLFLSVIDSKVFYELSYKGVEVIKASRLGFLMKPKRLSFDNNIELIESKISIHDSFWQPVLGQYRQIRSHYNELFVKFRKTTTNIEFIIRFRLFDDGLAFRYEFPKQKKLSFFIVKEELTEFRQTADHMMFWEPGDYNTDEYWYAHTHMSKVSHEMKERPFKHGENYPLFEKKKIVAVQTPLMIKTAKGLYINIHEAALSNFTSMQLNLDEKDYVLSSHLVPDAIGNKSYVQTDFNTPWRTVLVSDDARDILASSMILNLNDACVYQDTDWIKPVKYMGVWWEMFVKGSTWKYTDEKNLKISETDYSKVIPNKTHAANTENVKKYIDFAAKHGFEHLLVEGWNIGWEDWYLNWQEDVFDFVTPYPDFDIEELSEYARKMNVQLIMHHETSASVPNYERRIDVAFDFMEKYGYKAAKTGYVGYPIPRGEWRSGQWMIEHCVRVVKKAAKRKICVNSHEAVRPTGLFRTYPNWLAQESARGTEFESMGGNNPDHTCILPFTRLIGGPMDYTPGIFQIKLDYYNPKSKEKIHTTLVKQLALYVVIYSPLQMAADLPETYNRFLDAFQFIKDVGLDWDDTKILEAEPGDYVTIIRKEKNTDKWFLGSITDENPRKTTISLDMLDDQKIYEATIYEDADDAHWDLNPMKYKIYKMKVKKGDKLKIKCAAGGGFAASILPM